MPSLKHLWKFVQIIKHYINGAPLRCDSQKQFQVYYEGQLVGTLIADLIVEETIIVDTKVVSAFNDSHFAQILGYLNITGLKTGLLLNFKYSRLGIKRVSN